jgi:diguanylate cyclase (GGDEF)-like protein
MSPRVTHDETGSARRLAVLAGLLGAIGVVGWLDFTTGPRVGLSLLYLAPVAAAAWWLGAASAGVCGAAAGVAWLWADVASREPVELPVSLWNGFTRLAIYIAIGLLLSRVRSDRRRLTDLLEREKSLARTDPITGLMNHRGFVESLMREASRCRRTVSPLCLAFMDLDNFKQVNDRYGHAAGDAFLQRIARAISDTVRAGDIPARLGGDEFVILFWDVDRRAVEGIAQRLIDRVKEAGREYPEAGPGLSVGIAYFDVPPDSTEEILKRADNAMYEAKTLGKGLMAVWSSAPTPAPPAGSSRTSP